MTGYSLLITAIKPVGIMKESWSKVNRGRSAIVISSYRLFISTVLEKPVSIWFLLNNPGWTRQGLKNQLCDQRKLILPPENLFFRLLLAVSALS